MQPLRRMDFVSLQGPCVRIDSGKLYVFAEVIPAIITEEALFTWNARFDCDPVALGIVRV